MTDLNVVVGEQAYKCALAEASIQVSKMLTYVGEQFLHEPTACDTHESDDNVIFAQFVDLSNASIRHCGRIVTPTRSLAQA